jgi:hypothetical protein
MPCYTMQPVMYLPLKFVMSRKKLTQSQVSIIAKGAILFLIAWLCLQIYYRNHLITDLINRSVFNRASSKP